MCSVTEDTAPVVVDYRTEYKLAPPISQFATFEQWLEAVRNAPYCLPNGPTSARIHDIATERMKRGK